eukprot:1582184-Pleurochrysis_carterae.AAC.2
MDTVASSIINSCGRTRQGVEHWLSRSRCIRRCLRPHLQLRPYTCPRLKTPQPQVPPLSHTRPDKKTDTAAHAGVRQPSLRRALASSLRKYASARASLPPPILRPPTRCLAALAPLADVICDCSI